MWWWQSVAFGGAFSLGGSVPVEYFTCWASALREKVSTPTAAAPDAALSTCRRVHRVIFISSSLKVEHGPSSTGKAPTTTAATALRSLCRAFSVVLEH